MKEKDKESAEIELRESQYEKSPSVTAAAAIRFQLFLNKDKDEAKAEICLRESQYEESPSGVAANEEDSWNDSEELENWMALMEDARVKPVPIASLASKSFSPLDATDNPASFSSSPLDANDKPESFSTTTPSVPQNIEPPAIYPCQKQETPPASNALEIVPIAQASTSQHNRSTSCSSSSHPSRIQSDAQCRVRLEGPHYSLRRRPL